MLFFNEFYDDCDDFVAGGPEITIEAGAISSENIVSKPKVKLRECKAELGTWRYFFPLYSNTPLFKPQRGAFLSTITVRNQKLDENNKYCRRQK